MARPSLVKTLGTAEMCSHSEVSSEHWLSNVGSKGRTAHGSEHPCDLSQTQESSFKNPEYSKVQIMMEKTSKFADTEIKYSIAFKDTNSLDRSRPL